MTLLSVMSVGYQTCLMFIQAFDDEYFYKIALSGSEFIAKDLKKYCYHWLVSNEPDLNVFTGSMTLDQIARYLNSCAEGLKKGNSNALTGVNLFACINPSYSIQLIGKLYGQDSKMSFLGLDAYFWHPCCRLCRKLGIAILISFTPLPIHRF